MTLPAHRFAERAKKKDDPRTVVFDFDETITKAPEQLAFLADALRKAKARVVVVTGNESTRDELEERLNDYGFPFDGLIQYEDDQSDGLRRAAILKKLGAFLGVDDRAGRGYTYAKVCPHLFLVAKPPDEAEDNADGAKKAAKKTIKKQLRSAAPPPPNYREAETAGLNCGTCLMFDSGVCWGYGNASVDASHVCDSWAQDEGNPT